MAITQRSGDHVRLEARHYRRRGTRLLKRAVGRRDAPRSRKTDRERVTPGGSSGEAAGRYTVGACCVGSSMVTPAPLPGADRTVMAPPLSSTLRLAIVSPRPVPVALVE